MLPHWDESADGALALVIVLDQFPRNMFRNDPRTYASDALACDVARRAIDSGADARMAEDLRGFLYMPFMHSEHLADQERCIALFEQTGDAEQREIRSTSCGHHPQVRALPAPQPLVGADIDRRRTSLSGLGWLFGLRSA